MTKLFCDRCGKQILNRSDRALVTVEPEINGVDTFDLCEDCYKELTKFLEPVNLLSAAHRLNW